MKFSTRVKNAIKAFSKEESSTVEMNQLLDFLGISDTKENALSEATYFACIKVLSESIGKLPIKLLQHNENNGVVTARKHSLYDVLSHRPNPYMTPTSFWTCVEQNRNHFGNAYVWIKGFGKNMTLWILPSDEVEIVYDDNKKLSDVSDIYYYYFHNGKNYQFSSEEILHFKTSNTFDGIKGIAVKDQLKMTISGAKNAEKVVNAMYKSGFTAKAVVQYTSDLSAENLEKFTKGIEKFAGADLDDREARQIIPLPIGTSLTPMDIKLADNQFIDVKKYTALQIASAFGIKPMQIGDYEKSSFASAEAQQLSFYVDTLLYILKQYEEELNYKLLSEDDRQKGYYFKFNVAVILRADTKTQLESLANAVEHFIYTPNEARAFIDLEAKEGGDQLIGNGSTIPIQLVGSQYNNTQTDEGKEEKEAWMKTLITSVINEMKNQAL